MTTDLQFMWKYWDEKFDNYSKDISKLKERSDYICLSDVSPEYVEDYLYRVLKQQYENVTIGMFLHRWCIHIPVQNEIIIAILGFPKKNTICEACIDLCILNTERDIGVYQDIEDVNDILLMCKKIMENSSTDIYIFHKERLENQKKIRLHTMARSLIEAYSNKLLEKLGYKWKLFNLESSTLIKIEKTNGAMVELEIQYDNYLKTPELIKESINSLEMIDKFLS